MDGSIAGDKDSGEKSLTFAKPSRGTDSEDYSLNMDVHPTQISTQLMQEHIQEEELSVQIGDQS